MYVCVHCVICVWVGVSKVHRYSVRCASQWNVSSGPGISARTGYAVCKDVFCGFTM